MECGGHAAALRPIFPGQLRVRVAVRGAIEEGTAQYGCTLPELTIEEGLIAPAAGEKRRRVRRLTSRSGAS